MAKSKIAKQSKAVKHVRNNQNVVPLNLDIPYKDNKSTRVKQLDVSHLLYFGFLVSALFHNRNRVRDVAYLFIQNNSLTNALRFTKATVVKSESNVIARAIARRQQTRLEDTMPTPALK